MVVSRGEREARAQTARGPCDHEPLSEGSAGEGTRSLGQGRAVTGEGPVMAFVLQVFRL